MATRFPDKQPPPKQTSDDGYGLPEALRKVLYSPQKAELLCILEERGPMISNDLATALRNPIQRNSVNIHLNELEKLGWIHIVEFRQNRGGFSRVFDLTDRSISWAKYFAKTKKSAPSPVPPADEGA